MIAWVFRRTLLILLLLTAFNSLATGLFSAASLTQPLSPQIESATSESSAGLIFGNFLILCFYSFPMSFAENWALAGQNKAKKRPTADGSELNGNGEASCKMTQRAGGNAPAALKDGKTRDGRSSSWLLGLPPVPAGFAKGGCLMIGVVVLGAIGFALSYLIRDQPEKIDEIIPRFAYWFPFALLGMVTDLPFTFKLFDWENQRLRIILRLIIWWLPRVIIFIFMFNLPIVRELDPLTTALIVLAIDGVIAALVWLRTRSWNRGAAVVL